MASRERCSGDICWGAGGPHRAFLLRKSPPTGTPSSSLCSFAFSAVPAQWPAEARSGGEAMSRKQRLLIVVVAARAAGLVQHMGSRADERLPRARRDRHVHQRPCWSSPWGWPTASPASFSLGHCRLRCRRGLCLRRALALRCEQGKLSARSARFGSPRSISDSSRPLSSAGLVCVVLPFWSGHRSCGCRDTSYPWRPSAFSSS